VAKTFEDVLTASEVARLVETVRDEAPRYAALKTNGRYRALILIVCDVNPLQGEVTLGRSL
jgi:putative hemolysin